MSLFLGNKEVFRVMCHGIYNLSLKSSEKYTQMQRENGLPWWLRCLQCRRLRFDPWVGKISQRSEWQPTPVFQPGEFHGQRSLVGYSPWGRKESDMTERLTHTHNHFQSRKFSVEKEVTVSVTKFRQHWDPKHFPGGSVLKNSPTSAGDTEMQV